MLNINVYFLFPQLGQKRAKIGRILPHSGHFSANFFPQVWQYGTSYLTEKPHQGHLFSFNRDMEIRSKLKNCFLRYARETPHATAPRTDIPIMWTTFHSFSIIIYINKSDAKAMNALAWMMYLLLAFLAFKNKTIATANRGNQHKSQSYIQNLQAIYLIIFSRLLWSLFSHLHIPAAWLLKLIILLL